LSNEAHIKFRLTQYNRNSHTYTVLRRKAAVWYRTTRLRYHHHHHHHKIIYSAPTTNVGRRCITMSNIRIR